MRNKRCLQMALILSFGMSASAGAAEQKPVLAESGGIPDQFIVMLVPGPDSAEDVASELVLQFGGDVMRVWEEALRGFLITIDAGIAEEMANHPAVEGIYQDIEFPGDDFLANDTPYCYPEVSRGLDCDPPGDWIFNNRTFEGLPQTITCTDPDPFASGCIDNWGLDRLDGFSVQRDGKYQPPGDGTGVHIYVLDTGIKATNLEFGNRVSGGHNGTYDEPGCANCWPLCFPPCGTDTNDYHGHGTHVAGILGGIFAGVAKNVQLHPVRWYNNACRAVNSAVIDGLNWIMFDHQPNEPTALVNLSAAGPQWSTRPEFLPIQQAALSLSSRDNLLLIQAAGNGSQDACGWSFGDESKYTVGSPEYIATSKVIIVGGSDENDGRWTCVTGDENCLLLNSGSNVGNCLDLFAPAPHVVSAWHGVGSPGDEQAVCRLAGTSMAAPHVAGIAALILEKEPSLTAAEVKTRILGRATGNVLKSNPADPNFIGAGSPNLLANALGETIFVDGFESGDTLAWSTTEP